MDFSALLGGAFGSAFSGPMIDDLLVWGVAALAGVIALITLANALEMLIDAEAG